MAQTSDTSPKNNPANAGRALRLKTLQVKPADLSIQSSSEFPQVYGVIVDWPIGDHTATLVSFSSGDASLYTTATFGLIGGIVHDKVRAAAKKFVQLGNQYFDDAIPTKDYPYPAPNHVKFYLLTFHGVSHRC